MSGLLDGERGRRGPVKLTEEIVEFLRAASSGQSGAVLDAQVADRFGVVLHGRTVERARRL
jgi:hypothetical protein